MTETSEQRHATLALQLLLDGGAAPTAALDWQLLRAVADRNAVLVRLDDQLERLALRPPRSFTVAADRERQRVRAALHVVREIGDRCARHGIAFLFPKALQHYPDMGSDLDLLVLSESEGTDALLLEGLAASPVARSLHDRIAGATTYRLQESRLPLDVRHGRLGPVGEQASYPRALLANRQRCLIAGAEFFVPAPEDQLILQGMDRVSGRRSFRLGDVVATIATVRALPIAWTYVTQTARAIGVLAGLGCYLSYVEQIHQALYGRGLLPPDAHQGLLLRGWGRATFHHGAYRFPAVRVGNRLYWRQLATSVGAGNWRAASRLCLWPAAVAGDGLRRLARARSRDQARPAEAT